MSHNNYIKDVEKQILRVMFGGQKEKNAVK